MGWTVSTAVRPISSVAPTIDPAFTPPPASQTGIAVAL
jgi:hypothetical protein